MTNPDTFDLRDATMADVPAIVALVQSAYRGETSRVGWTTEADLLDGQRIDAEGVNELIARADSLVLLAEHDGQLFACAHVERRGEAGYFGMFAVAPAMQARGLGRRMLTAAERLARERWSVRLMTLTVIDLRADLIAWYLRRGYRRTGEHEPFPYGDPRFGTPRRDDLRFERLERNLAIISHFDEEMHA
jgi:N-acetylglutamate synthase-like GNAT family acetyltransferase